jgi:hypothetical protein
MRPIDTIPEGAACLVQDVISRKAKSTSREEWKVWEKTILAFTGITGTGVPGRKGSVGDRFISIN